MISEKRTGFENAVMLMTDDEAIRATPRMRVILMKHSPMMLPNAKLRSPFLTDDVLVKNAGMLVPKATIVAPITIGGIPTLVAMLEDDSTVKNAATTTTAALASIYKVWLRSP